MIKPRIEGISWVKETIAVPVFGRPRRYFYGRVGEDGQRRKEFRREERI
jgi:hypothetical protein